MSAQKESDFQFKVQVSGQFEKSLGKIRDAQLRKKINEHVALLARGFQYWRRLSTKKIEVGDPSRCVRSVRINDGIRMIFEGPINYKGELFLFIHDVCSHDDYLWRIKSFSKASHGQTRISDAEIELSDDEMVKEDKGLDEDTTVFSKNIPTRGLLTPELIDAILISDKANRLLTKIQRGILLADRPLLINGQAGSGKTLMLCNRLALSIYHKNTTSRFAFLTYNDKLVKQAQKDTEEILELQLGYNGGLGGVDFRPLQAFLKDYVTNKTRFAPERYIPYGLFKEYYEMYRRGNPVAKRISCEVAWHGIRSILKGACIPPLTPPLTREKYNLLAKKRRDFPSDMFDDIYDIGDWYQKEIIQKKQLWDDQDLAWTALKWIFDLQKTGEKIQLYDEIFCDEGQDLTEIEFKFLVSLCKQPLAGREEGIPLVFAGDPLQTINPTGFRWSTIKNEVYSVQGRPVSLHFLKENFRSDKRIVKFANYIQETRSRYLSQPVEEQKGFEKDGDIPQIITTESQDEISLIEEKLGELSQIPDVAVIVWPEGADQIQQLCKQEKALNALDPTVNPYSINPYSVSEAKGLEFRLVVLYKFGSSEDMLRWKDILTENKSVSSEDEIPLLYFLNRLYVAVTRAKSFLVIVDTNSGVENFLSIWKKAEQNRDLYIWPRADIRSLLDSHPAFRGDSSNEAWRKWAEKLFDYAERTRDLRLYERARRAYEKAGETQNVKRIDARLYEIGEKWATAGEIYFSLNQFEEARMCYSKVDDWNNALKAAERLPTTPETRRYIAFYRFKIGCKQKTNDAAAKFYEYALTDDNLGRELLEELGIALIQAGDISHAAQIFLTIARRFNDKAVLIRAADIFYSAKEFQSAEKLYSEGGETKSRNYCLSRAHNLLQKGEYVDAAKLFFENDGFKKVVEIYALVEQGKGASPKGKLLELTGDSYFKLGFYDKAIVAYRSFLSELGKVRDLRIIGQIGACLENMGDKYGAYKQYCEACMFKRAADLGVELGIADEEIIRLRTREAMENNDFERAAMLAHNSDDEKLVHITAGQYFARNREFVKAIPEFIKGEMWREAIDSIIQAQAQAGGRYNEELTQLCDFLIAVAKSSEVFDYEVKGQIMRFVGHVEDDPSWETHIQPSEMGKVYEKCAHFGEAARYYKSRNEKWAKEGWFRVKSAQMDSFRKLREFEKVAQIEKEISLARREEYMNLMGELEKEHNDIIIQTDKVKDNKGLSNQEKHNQYVNIIAFYLEKHVPTSLKLVKPPFVTDLPTQFSLLLVKGESLPELTTWIPSYKLEDVAAAIEIRGHGWVEKANKLEGAIKRKKECYDGIKAKNGHIKCLYLTLEERRKTKEGPSYHELSKKYLDPIYFSLRDSTTKSINPHEWENFVQAMTQN